MIKGVNKQVVEVLETESEYFERVLFFVNPKYYGMSESKLKEKAQTVLNGTGVPPKSKKIVRNKLALIFTAVCTAFVTAIVTAIFISVIK